MNIRKLDDPSKCTWQNNSDHSKTPHTRIKSAADSKPKILPNILHAIGNTPLVKLNRIPTLNGVECEILVKCEFLNPGGSLKDRIALRTIEDLERADQLKPGCTIVEASAGNTGIAVSMVCAVKGCNCIIVMPDKYVNDKDDIVKAFGAEVIVAPTDCDIYSPESAFGVYADILRNTPNSNGILQFQNACNPLTHYDTTALEIYDQCDGRVDMVVAVASTGGTLTGIGRKLKELNPACVIVGVDAEISGLFESNGSLTHSTEVAGLGFFVVPTVLDKSVVDFWVKVSDKDAFSMARCLLQQEGLLCGASSGAAVVAALKASTGLKKDQRCVVILADGSRNYANQFLSNQWMEIRKYKPCVNSFNHWWWNKNVSVLNPSAPVTVSVNVSCSTALTLMKKNGCNQLPVVYLESFLVGMVTISSIMELLVSCKIQLTDLVTKALSTNFIKLNTDTHLGLISRALEKNPYVVIIEEGSDDSSDHSKPNYKKLRGVITQIDLLHFIENSSKANIV